MNIVNIHTAASVSLIDCFHIVVLPELLPDHMNSELEKFFLAYGKIQQYEFCMQVPYEIHTISLYNPSGGKTIEDNEK